MKQFRPIVSETSRGRLLLECIGQLCAGKHPSAEILDRARNRLGFHWDAEAVQPIVRAFRRNSSLVRFEQNADKHSVHHLAADVLALALIPEADESAASEAAKDGNLEGIPDNR
jgi:hypothetical protein